MTSVLTLLAQHVDEIHHHASRLGLKNVRVAGSVARGTEHPASDVDLVVENDAATTLDLAEFAAHVAGLTQREVDVFVLPAEATKGSNATARALLADAVRLGQKMEPASSIPHMDPSGPIEKLLRVARVISTLVSFGHDRFMDDRILRDSMTLHLQEISHAARADRLRDAQPELRLEAWSHVLSAASHSRALLWQVASQDVPHLERQLNELGQQR